jgi:tRNA(Arg) A34 adenosine deaminase TadA
MRKRDEEFMAEALGEARRSLELDEFPVGAVVVIHDEVVVRAHWTGGRSADFWITRNCLR